MNSKQRCPKCHSSGHLIPIVYGLPSGEILAQAAREEVQLGGIKVSDVAPTWYCRQCKAAVTHGTNRGAELREFELELLGGLLLNLGHLKERADKPEVALALFEEAVALAPQDPMAHYNLGDTLLTLGRHEEALAALDEAIKLSPDADLFHYDRGLALYHLGRLEDALPCFDRVMTADRKLTRAHTNLGLNALQMLALCQGDLGFWRHASQTLSAAVPLVAHVLYNLGRFALRDQEHEDALRYFEACDRLAPNSEETLHGIALALMDTDRLREAEDVFARAVRIDPKCADAWADRAISLARMKKPALRTKARAYLRKALAIQPAHAGAFYELACLDALDKRVDAAFGHLERAIAAGFKDLKHVRKDPDLRVLRKDSRWGKIVR